MMAYTPTQWNNGGPPGISAERLNKIETGIKDAHDTADGAASAISTHSARTDNPHNVTKSQVGLGSVQNYGIASQAQAEAGSANNVYMTPLRTKQYVDTRLQNNLQFRMNSGIVEYNDGTGWKSVGFDPRTMELNSFNHFVGGITVGAGSYSDIFTINGQGVLSEFAIYVSATSNNDKLGVSLVTDGNEVPLYLYDDSGNFVYTPVVRGWLRFDSTNVQTRILEFNSLAAYESSLIIRIRNESGSNAGGVQVVLRGVYYT